MLTNTAKISSAQHYFSFLWSEGVDIILKNVNKVIKLLMKRKTDKKLFMRIL